MTTRRRAGASSLAATIALTMATAIVTPTASTRAARAEEGSPAQIRIDREVGAGRNLALEMGQNRLLVLSEPIARVSVADPKVADLKVITSNQLLLTARGAGSTDLTLWNKKDEPLVLALLVTRNLDALHRQVHDLFPAENIAVAAAGDLIVLSGEATDVRVPERAAELAQLHAERVVNLIRMSGNQQVQLEVKFAEVSRTGLREMGLNLFQRDRSGRFVSGIAGPTAPAGNFLGIPGTGSASQPGIIAPAVNNAFSLFFSGLSSFPFSAMLSLLESNGLAKTLAEPTLVAMSGQEAKFLAGGEFPIPVSTGLGAVNIQWKKFGIILNFTPTVVSDGILNLKLFSEVSDIDPGRSITIGGFTVPALISRQSETTIRLSDGQSFAIAGLLSNQIRSQIDKVPLLGDIPILGSLFRSTSYKRAETELLVVVTARLTKPVAAHELPRLPTDDELNDPNDFELFLLGSEGRDPPPHTATAAGAAPAALPTSPKQHAKRGPSGEIGFIR